jgi:hypothetical protein
MKALGLLLMALVAATSPVLAEQRDFPTGEPGSTVTYLDAGGPGHPTACVVAITAGLPLLAVSFSLFSNNKFTIMVASQQAIPTITSGSAATLMVNSVYIFLKVTDTSTSGRFDIVNLAPLEESPIKSAYDALNQIVVRAARVDVVANDAQLPTITLPAEPNLGATIGACQQYLLRHL